MNQVRHGLAGLALISGLVLNCIWISAASAEAVSAETVGIEAFSNRFHRFCRTQLDGDIFARTELFFGLSRPGGEITEEEFQHFINTEVTPRFPDGLTLLSGIGQFKDSTGNTIQEGSRILILLYPFNKKNNRAIEKIRREYKQAFDQQSVLRVDEPSCVSF